MSKPKFHRGSPVSAISIRQPWAWLVACGFKQIENRSRPTRFRGRVAIHASSSSANMSPDMLDEILAIDSDDNVLWDASCVKEDAKNVVFAAGAIIGSVEIYDCVEIDDLNPSDIENKYNVDQLEFASGPYCYLLRNAKRYKSPIKLSGKVSIPWAIPESIVKSVADLDSKPLRNPMKPHQLLAT